MSYSEQLCEQMSAFLDGELPDKEIELLLRRLEREPQLREKIARYAAIGESLRGEPEQVSRGFTARVSMAIAQESRLSRLEPAAAVVPRQQDRARPQWLRTAGGLIGGLSIAATVAGVAIVILQRQQNPVSGAQIAGTQTVVIGDTRGFGSSEAPSYTVPSPATTHPVVAGTRLTDYVLAHSEYSSPLGRRNVLSGIIAEDPTLIDAAGGVAPPRVAVKTETTETPPPAPAQTAEPPAAQAPVSEPQTGMPGNGQPPEIPESQP